MSSQKSASKKSADDDQVAEKWDHLTEKLASLRDDISQVNDAAADLARTGAAEGRDRIVAEIEELTRQAAALSAQVETRGRAAGHQAARKAEAFGEEFQGTIRDHPLAAVLIAAGLGALIGMASRRS